MKTTFDKFITNNPTEKKKFDKEYSEFLLSEFVLEKMEEKHYSVRGLAEKVNVSPTVIQKLRSGRTADHISYRTFLDVIDTLGYKISLVRK
jgi:ribosome-binding protein aMBF1 (putative translation factor)